MGAGKGEALSVYLTARRGAEKILWEISQSPLNQKLLLRNSRLLAPDRFRRHIISSLGFFVLEEEMREAVQGLERIFLPENGAEGSLRVVLQEKREGANAGPPVFLEISEGCYRVPFQIFLIPYRGSPVSLQEKELEENYWGEGKISYSTFPPEEYVSRCFYEILVGLELIKDLSWYKEIYDILVEEPMNGRKVWERFSYILSENPIPSVERRLDTIKSYENYRYMEKRWKSQGRREGEKYPPWGEVVRLAADFFTPIFEGVMRDELFLGDWMPQIGRYLD